jgi:hypothetical protein
MDRREHIANSRELKCNDCRGRHVWRNTPHPPFDALARRRGIVLCSNHHLAALLPPPLHFQSFSNLPLFNRVLVCVLIFTLYHQFNLNDSPNRPIPSIASPRQKKSSTLAHNLYPFVSCVYSRYSNFPIHSLYEATALCIDDNTLVTPA